MLKQFASAMLVMLTCCMPAYADDNGTECSTPAAMTARLKAEGQRSFASADRFIDGKPLRGMIFTVNADRTAGYILQADEAIGDPAKQICVWSRLVDVRLYDARKPGTPQEVLLKASETDAAKRCDELSREGKLKRNGCASLNSMISKAEKWGARVMMQGFITMNQPDGSFKRSGVLATVSGRIGGKLSDYPDKPGLAIGGDLTISALPEGASTINAIFVYPEYTPYGLEVLGRR